MKINLSEKDLQLIAMSLSSLESYVEHGEGSQSDKRTANAIEKLRDKIAVQVVRERAKKGQGKKEVA